LREAKAIGGDLARRAIRDVDGSAAWIGLARISQADRYQHQPLSARLYDGSAGVALFLAALERAMPSHDFGELALAAVRPLRRFLHTAGEGAVVRLARDLGVGGATGLGSVIYAFVLIADFLSYPDLLADAALLADLISDELLDRDKQLDVTGGMAGAILGLLALHARTSGPGILRRATDCGWRLLAARISYQGRPRAWRTIEPEPLTGFGHGAAGIAYALLRLYAATAVEDFRDAAAESNDYERHCFNETLGNWQDLRRSGRVENVPWYMVNWCHGAAGIGLARLGGLAMFDTPEVRQDIEAALATTRKWGAQAVDHLCCGNAGRVELFLSAAAILNCAELRERALRHATWVVNRARGAGGYRLFPNLTDHVFSPGLFQGTAGIGYLLLRLADPRAFPSVLLWQTTR
jgi:type 2 lantibiotic biosynthesis protein LanM